MARVSQEHLDARRRQILDGATRCFARSGFHAASMQDVLREIGLSPGAVYRYFSGKDELIAAIATEVFADVRAAFEAAAEQSPPPLPHELLARVVGQVVASREGLRVDGRPAFPGLVLQVWAETLRDERLQVLLWSAYAEMCGVWVRLVESYRAAGLMSADVPADHVARTMIALAQGFIAQQALFGEASPDVLRDGLKALTTMERPAAEAPLTHP
ncbi:TetR/AcrR family transcriptional regulator [Streptomyces sp. NPDC004111]|uniref:TetR/AcrR family transcriptional regulator n=1 Tax=Streptomyces sp. NPDC004111 TaxID=3364690 RepID=UPI003695BD44